MMKSDIYLSTAYQGIQQCLEEMVLKFVEDEILEYSDRLANLSFIPARLHSKVCDTSLAWRTEYGHAHDNLFTAE